jgi:preprotein translocase subunit SecE
VQRKKAACTEIEVRKRLGVCRECRGSEDEIKRVVWAKEEKARGRVCK